MTTYDAVMAGLVVAGMIWGAIRGITWQVASIASLVLGYVVSFPVSGQLAGYFPGEPVVARGLSMLVVYVGVSGGVYGAAWLIRATLRRLKFEAYDRHLGMLLGGAEGALLGLIGTLFVLSLAPQSRGPIQASPTGKAVNAILSHIQPALPPEVCKVLAPFWGEGSSEPAAGMERWRPLVEEGGVRDTFRERGVTAVKSGATGDSAAVEKWLQDGKEKVSQAVSKAVSSEIEKLGKGNGRTPSRR